MAATKVLIVDDDPDIVFITRTFLTREGMEVLDAADGVEGLKRILEDAPDLVLLDVMMPGMDGYQVCERIKHGERGGSLPIVFLSAKTSQADVDRAFEAGGDDYLTKPFEPNELLETIWRLTQPSIGVERRWRTTNPLAIQDAEVRRFVQDHLHSLAQWTILEHFMKAKSPTMTAKDVSSWYSSASHNQVVQELGVLVASGALALEEETGEYRLSDEPEIRTAMEKFFGYCTKMDARLRVICMILESSN